MVTKLETIINQKDNEIRVLQDRVEELEQYTRKENIIISGLRTRHMSYARATSNSATAASMDNAPQEETNALEKHVIFSWMTSYKLTLNQRTSVCVMQCVHHLVNLITLLLNIQKKRKDNDLKESKAVKRHKHLSERAPN